jgi:hypothetical protein
MRGEVVGINSFIDVVTPVAERKGMGIIAMKVYFGGLASRIPGFRGMEPFFRFALSLPVSTAVIGCDTIHQLERNVGFAASFSPMSKGEMEGLVDYVSPYAGQLMYYKP